MGRVAAVGPGADAVGLKLGERVALESHLVDGTCQQCISGNRHLCENTRTLGIDVDGGFAELVAVPAANAWPVDGLPGAEYACVLEPLGNAVHVVLAQPVAGESVAVFGCGPIGLFAVAVARAVGAYPVIALDIRPNRLELATALGADVTLDAGDAGSEDELRGLPGGGPAVCLEMSGSAKAMAVALRAVRRGGKVVLFGLPRGPVTLDVERGLIFKGVTVEGIVGRRLPQTWQQMDALLRSGRLDIRAAITHELPLESFEEAFRLMKTGVSGKVVLHP
jgi:threonine 3-dehydrogenase